MSRKRRGRPVHGWLVIDKPPGMTSTQVLGKVRYLMGAEKAGHGGTLDPLGTGVLPIAFGEATKTVAWAMDGKKVYHFTVRWGESRDSDDSEGAVTGTSDVRPTPEAVREVLSRFTGEIEQVPPRYSAIKIEGARAYDLARAGAEITMAVRRVWVGRIELIACPDPDHAVFEVLCGKGTYMRSLARDIALAVGTLGHVAALRRLSVGRFTLDDAISLDALAALGQGAALDDRLLPIETALDGIPALALSAAEAHRLRQGQPVGLFRRQDVARLEGVLGDTEDGTGIILVTCAGKPVALAAFEGAELRPVRVLNLVRETVQETRDDDVDYG